MSEVLTTYTLKHYAAHRAVRSGTRSGTWRRIDEASLRASLDKALCPASADAVTDERIDDCVEHAVSQGFDGEYLVSEIIIRETHKHTGLMLKEISKLRGSLPEVDPSDLLGFAWRGLRVALRQYDPSRGFTFSTYACPKINGAIRDGVRSEHYLPKRLTTFARKVSAAEEHLTQTLQRTPTFDDIAAYLDDAGASLELAGRLHAPASLDEMTDIFGQGDREPSCLVDHQSPEDHAMVAARREGVRTAMADLEPEARDLMVLLFFDEVTLTTAADRLGIDVRAARAMRDTALSTLRLDLAAWSVPA